VSDKKRSTSFQLSPEGLLLLKRLSRRLGLSQASVVELAVRKLADAEGVPRPEPTEEDSS
jgi:hypothetical protein